MRRSILVVTTLAGLAALALLAGTRGHNAAPATPAPAPPAASGRIRCEGRVVTYPGADIVVSAEYGGRIRDLPIHELDRVAAGQLLARLDGSEQEAALASARAHVRELDAELGFLALEQRRQKNLLEEGAVGQRAFDDADAKLRLTQSRREAAVASASQLEAVLAKLTLRAPFAGTLVQRFPEPGELLPAGGRLARLADLDRLRVEAEVDEYDLPRIQAGGEAEVEVEGREGTLRGRVEEVPAAVSARALKALDPGRPSDIRVALVKVSLPKGAGLKLGQRVELSLLPR